MLGAAHKVTQVESALTEAGCSATSARPQRIPSSELGFQINEQNKMKKTALFESAEVFFLISYSFICTEVTKNMISLNGVVSKP